MLELRTYTIDDINVILGTTNRQGVQRKLNRCGVKYSVSGCGTNTKFEIKSIDNEFKLFCMLGLGMSANTDFHKFLYFMYYFLNDEDFCWLPDETLEIKMDERNAHISRQTIANYKRQLENKNLFCRVGEYVYYFARGQTQIMTDKETYSRAWREYWENKDSGMDSQEAICIMCANYGGVARKQAIMVGNAICGDTIDKLNDLVCNAVEKEALSENCENTEKQDLSKNEQFIF